MDERKCLLITEILSLITHHFIAHFLSPNNDKISPIVRLAPKPSYVFNLKSLKKLGPTHSNLTCAPKPLPGPINSTHPNFTLPSTPTISSRNLITNKCHPPTLDDLVVVVHVCWMISLCLRLWSRSHSGCHRSELWPPLGWMISSAW